MGQKSDLSPLHIPLIFHCCESLLQTAYCMLYLERDLIQGTSRGALFSSTAFLVKSGYCKSRRTSPPLLSQELLIHCYWNTLLGLIHCPQTKQIKLQGPHPSLGCPQPPATPAQATSTRFTQGAGRCQNKSCKTQNSRRFWSIQNFPFPAVGLQVQSTSLGAVELAAGQGATPHLARRMDASTVPFIKQHLPFFWIYRFMPSGVDDFYFFFP